VKKLLLSDSKVILNDACAAPSWCGEYSISRVRESLKISNSWHGKAIIDFWCKGSGSF